MNMCNLVPGIENFDMNIKGQTIQKLMQQF